MLPSTPFKICYDAKLLTRDVQVRFPRSRKARIRRKWAARDRNWRFRPHIVQVGDTYIMHPSFCAELKRDFV